MVEDFKQTLNEVKDQLSNFVNDYYKEQLKIWTNITNIEANQKIILSIMIAILMFFVMGSLK